METKKQDKKQALTLLVANLPVVGLTDKDMSEVNGGHHHTSNIVQLGVGIL